METKNNEKHDKGNQIKVEIYSRSNFINGNYKIGQLGLDDLSKVKANDIFFLESLRMKADLADKMISKARSQGENIADPEIIKKLGEEINAIYTPIHRSNAIMTAIFNSLGLIVYYGVAVGIWGLVLKKSFLMFSFYGAIFGFLIGLLFVRVAFQRTLERVKDLSSAIGMIWGNLAIVAGIVGLIVWVLKSVYLLVLHYF